MIVGIVFHYCHCDHSVFVKYASSGIVFAIFVDDIMLTEIV